MFRKCAAVLLVLVAAAGITRWIKASDHKDSALLGAAHMIASRSGMTVFAGMRDDPFFFDLVQFKKIIAGEAAAFRNPGIDSFAGTNVLAIAVELPSARLGGPRLGVWGTTSRQQF